MSAYKNRVLFAAFISLTLAACGGGGGGGSTPPANLAPVASAGPDFAVAEQTLVKLDGSASSDADGRVARFAWTQVLGPSVSIANADTAVATFTAPDVSAPTALAFRLEVIDDAGASGTDEVTVTVNPVSNVPFASDGAFGGAEDTPLSDRLTASDADSPDLTFSAVTQPAHGTLALKPDGSFTYTPSANFNGTDRFTFKASDGQADSNVATATLNIAPVNDPPQISPIGNQVVDEDGTVGPIAFTVSDVDGDPLTVTVQSGSEALLAPSGIVVSGSGSDRTLTLTPVANRSGEVGVGVTVSDGTATSGLNFVLTVRPVNDAPTANAASASGAENSTITGAVSGNDVDGDSLTFAKASDPAHGSATVNADGSFSYTPVANYNGSDSFTFTANDGQASSAPATVTITVNAVNAAPQAFDDGAVTDEDTPAVINVLANDVDSDSALDPASITIVAAAHGTATTNAQGQVSFLPDANYFGTDASFRYTVKDTEGAESNVATVAITVNPVNDAPSAKAASASGDEDGSIAGTLTASDVDGDSLSFAKASDPAHGSVTVNTDGTFSYAPAANYNGSDSFTFTASDGKANSAPAAVTLTVNPVNDAPSATAAAFSAEQDSPLAGQLSGSDVDGDHLTFAKAGGPAHGALTVNADGSFSYTPAAGFKGSDAFTFVASDGQATSEPATASITVSGVLLRVGAAKRSIVPTQAQIDGITEERAFGAGAHLQKFNLGGFGVNVSQGQPDEVVNPVMSVGNQIADGAGQDNPIVTEPASRRVFVDKAGQAENTNLRLMVVEQKGTQSCSSAKPAPAAGSPAVPTDVTTCNGGVVVFVMMDAIGAGNLIQAGVKKAIVDAGAAMTPPVAVSPENILFGLTHSHTAADLQGLWGGVPQDWIVNVLYKAAGAAATEAFATRRPAHLSFKQGYTSDFNNYRRPRIDPNADADGTITLLSATAADGSPIGSILQYNAHPTSIGDGNKPRTPHSEYILGAMDWLEGHGGGTSLYFNGPIADASPEGQRPGCANREAGNPDPSAGAFGYVRCRGEGIADYLLHPEHVISGHELVPTLELRSTQVVLPITNPLFLATAAAGSFNHYYNFAELPTSAVPGLTPDMVASLPQAAPVAVTTVSRVTLGGADTGLEIVSIPGETTNTMGNYIRGLAKTNVMLMGLTHNSFGYILPEEEFSYVAQDGDNGFTAPFTGYEEFVSLGPLTAPLLRSEGWNRLFGMTPTHDVPPAVSGCADASGPTTCALTMLEERINLLVTSVEACIQQGPGSEACPLGNAGFPGGIPGTGPLGLPSLDTRLIAASADAQLRGCDMLDSSECLFPFPSDHFMVPAAANSPQGVNHGGTGKRLNLNIAAMPRNTAGKPIDPTEWNRQDGFSPGQLIVTYVPGIGTVKDEHHKPIGPITGAVPITDIPRYLDADAPIMVIDATAGTPEYGQRWPIYAEIDLNAGYVLPMQGLGPREDKQPALLIRAAKNYLEGHRYVVVLRNLKNDYGQPLFAGPAFTACRDLSHDQLAAMPTVQARCDELDANVFPVLGTAGVSRNSALYLAWDFTVASAHNNVSRLVAMRDDAFKNYLGDTKLSEPGQPGYPGGRAPNYTVSAVTENPDGANGKTVRRVEGYVTVPSYLVPADAQPLASNAQRRALVDQASQGNAGLVLQDLPPNRLYYLPDASSTAACDADPAQVAGGCAEQARYGDGLPDRVPGAEIKVRFTCDIPRFAVSGKASMTAATRDDVRPVRPTLYGHGLVGSQEEGNGQASDFGNVYGLMTCMTNWGGFAESDVGNILTILADVSNFPTLPDASQQGVLGMMFLARLATHPDGFAADPNFQVQGRPVLDRREVFYHGNSQGGIMGGVLVATSKDINRGTLGVLGMNYSTLLMRSTDFAGYSVPLFLAYQKDLERPFILSLMQMLWDRGENDGYVGAIASNSPELHGPANALLLEPAIGDHQVSMWTAEVMARTLGAKLDRHRVRSSRHPDQDASEYFGLTPIDYAGGEHWAGSTLVPYDQMYDPATRTEHWNSQNDDRCDSNATEPPPIGNIPPNRTNDTDAFVSEVPTSQLPAGVDKSWPHDAGSDPHECPRRDPQARCQSSHFLLPSPAVAGNTGPELVDVKDIAIFAPSADTDAGCPAVILKGAPETGGTLPVPAASDQFDAAVNAFIAALQAGDPAGAAGAAGNVVAAGVAYLSETVTNAAGAAVAMLTGGDGSAPVGTWLAGDMHVHDDHSADGSFTRQGPGQGGPGNVSVADQISFAEAQGLDFLPLTDHRTFDQHYDPLWKSSKMILITGEEANGSPHANVFGAVDMINQGDSATAAPAFKRVQQSIWDAHGQGAAWQTNHPGDGEVEEENPNGVAHTVKVNSNAQAAGPDLVEMWNRGERNSPKLSYCENRWNAGYRFGIAGASDNHFKELWPIAGPGSPLTHVFAGEKSTPALLEAFRTGHTVINRNAAAPFVTLTGDFDGDGKFEAMGGDEVRLPAGAHATLRVSVENGGGSTVTVYRMPGMTAGAFKTFQATAGSEHFDFEITGEHPQDWYRVEVRGAGDPDGLDYNDPSNPLDADVPLRALTSPIFVSTGEFAHPDAPELPADAGAPDGAQLLFGEATDNAFAGFARVAVAGGITHAVAEVRSGHASHVLYRARDAGGLLDAPVDLSPGSKLARQPAIAASGNDVWVAFQDEREGELPHTPQIYLAHSRDGGVSWDDAVQLSHGTARSQRPDIALTPDGSPVVVWENNDTGNFDIYEIVVGQESTPKNLSDDGRVYPENPADTRSAIHPASVSAKVAVSREGTIAVGWQTNQYDVDPGWTGHMVSPSDVTGEQAANCQAGVQKAVTTAVTALQEQDPGKFEGDPGDCGFPGHGTQTDDWEIQVTTRDAGDTQWYSWVVSLDSKRADRHVALAYDSANALHIAWDSKDLGSMAGPRLEIRERMLEPWGVLGDLARVTNDARSSSQRPAYAANGDALSLLWTDGRSDDWRWRVMRTSAGIAASEDDNSHDVLASDTNATFVTGPGNGQWPSYDHGVLVFTSDRSATREQRKPQQVFLRDLDAPAAEVATGPYTAIADADRDNVPDSEDQCLYVPGPAYNHGCPTQGPGLPLCAGGYCLSQVAVIGEPLQSLIDQAYNLVAPGATPLPAQGVFKVGTGQAGLAPKTKTCIGGGSTQCGRAADPSDPNWIRDPMISKATAITGANGQTFIVVSTTNIGYFLAYKPEQSGFNGIYDVRLRIAQATGVPSTNITVVSDHSHNGPDTIGIWGGVSADYMKITADAVVKAAVDAFNSRRDAVIKVAAINQNQHLEPGVGRLKTSYDISPGYDLALGNPYNEFRLMTADDATTGARILTFVNYAPHATVTNGDKFDGKYRLTGDWAAWMPQEAERIYGGMGLATVGALGNTDWNKTGSTPAAKEAEARARLRTLMERATAKLTKVAGAGVQVESTFVREPVLEPALIPLSYKPGVDRNNDAVPTSGLDVRIDRSVLPPFLTGGVVGTYVASARIGDVFFTMFPGEPFGELNHALVDEGRVQGPRVTFLLGGANDFFGYMVKDLATYQQTLRDEPLYLAGCPDHDIEDQLGVAHEDACSDHWTLMVSPTFGSHIICTLQNSADKLGFKTANRDAECPAFTALDGLAPPPESDSPVAQNSLAARQAAVDQAYALAEKCRTTPAPAQVCDALATGAQQAETYLGTEAPGGGASGGLPPVIIQDPLDPCTGPAGDPAPNTPEYEQRDAANMYCTHQRHEDTLQHPGSQQYMLQNYGGDPYRDPAVLTGHRFRHAEFDIASVDSEGGTSFHYGSDPTKTPPNAEVYYPCAAGTCTNMPAGLKTFEPPYPVAIVLHGAASDKKHLYWASQPLAERGYFVLTVNGTGASTGHTLVPKLMDWLFDPANPYKDKLDLSRIGITGHSLGAENAISAQGDSRISGIVGWDPCDGNFGPNAPNCSDSNGSRVWDKGAAAQTPTLFLTADYDGFPGYPQPAQSISTLGQLRVAGYKTLRDNGVDTMLVTTRATTHLDFAGAFTFGNRLNEATSLYYTLSWFDRYVNGKLSLDGSGNVITSHGRTVQEERAYRQDIVDAAFTRLTAAKFDTLIEQHDISMGFYDAAKAVAAGGDFAAGNVPYKVTGLALADRYSFYHPSVCTITRADLLNGTGGKGQPVLARADTTPSGDMRKTGCPLVAAPVDTDGDGVPDAQDAFPNDPTESSDADHDGIGDNADTDDDNDGVPDTSDNCANTPSGTTVDSHGCPVQQAGGYPLCDQFFGTGYCISDVPGVGPAVQDAFNTVYDTVVGGGGQPPPPPPPASHASLAGCVLTQDPGQCSAAISGLGAGLQGCDYQGIATAMADSFSQQDPGPFQDWAGSTAFCSFNALYDAVGVDTAATTMQALIEQCYASPASPACALVRSTADGTVPDAVDVLSQPLARGDLRYSELAAVTPSSKTVDGNIDDWMGAATRIGGTDIYEYGEHIYTDFLFDAYGADNGEDARRLAVIGLLGEASNRFERVDSLQQAAGDQLDVPQPAGSRADHYGDRADREDGTDLTEVRWAADGDQLYFLARVAMLQSADNFVTIVLADTGAGGDMKGLDAGLSSKVFDRALVLRRTGSRVIDLHTGASTSLDSQGGSVAVNASGYVNALEAGIPRALLERADGKIKVVVMTARVSGNSFIPANVAYRFDEPVSIYSEHAQALALFGGNIDAFVKEIALSDLTGGRTQSARPGAGYHERQFISGSNISAESDKENGQLQPYGIYVPKNFGDAPLASRMTIWTHYRGGKAHSGAAWTPRLFRELGDDHDNIVVSPRGRGTSTWYTTRAHQDFFEVFADVAGTDALRQYATENLPADHQFTRNGLFTIDSAHTYISGYSMGGFATYLFGGLYPDLFAGGFAQSGAVTQGAWTGYGPEDAQCVTPAQEIPVEGDPGNLCFIEANDSRADAQLNWRILDNLRYVPLEINHGTNDELALTPGAERMAERMLELGYRYDIMTFIGYEHFTQAIMDEWADGAHYLNFQAARPENPRAVTYKVVPALVKAVNEVQLKGVNGGHAFNFHPDGAYWVDDLVVRTGADGSIPATGVVPFGQIEAESGRLEDRSHQIVPRSGTDVSANTDDPAASSVYVSTPVYSPGNHTTPYIRHGLDWLDTGAIAGDANTFSATLTNLSAATLDLSRMGFDGHFGETIVGSVNSDGAASLTLKHFGADMTACVNNTTARYVNAGDDAVIPLVSGANAIRLVPGIGAACGGAVAPPPVARETPGYAQVCEDLGVAQASPVCAQLRSAESQLRDACAQNGGPEGFCTLTGGNLHALVEACSANNPAEATVPACRIVDALAGGASMYCAQAAPGQADAMCATLGGVLVSEAAMQRYESSWVHRALALQDRLGFGLPLVANTLLHTHNSFNATANNLPATASGSDYNQYYSIPDQLRMDIRGIEMDVHWMPGRAGSADTRGFEPMLCHGLSGDQLNGGCTTERPLAEGLAEFRGWMDAHPKDVVMLYIEDDLSGYTNDGTSGAGAQDAHVATAQVVEDNIGDLVFRPADHGSSCNSNTQAGDPNSWLNVTRQQMLDAGKRVLLITENCAGGAWDGLFHQKNDGNWQQGTQDNFDRIAYPECKPGDAGLITSNRGRKFTRVWEDTTLVTASGAEDLSGGNAPSGGPAFVTVPVMRELVRCGMNLPGVDRLYPSDGRLEAAVWSWAPGEPAVNGTRECALLNANGRFAARACDETHPHACVADHDPNAWTLGAAGAWSDAAACPQGTHFGVPANGYANEMLKQVTGGAPTWLNYAEGANEGQWLGDAVGEPETTVAANGGDSKCRSLGLPAAVCTVFDSLVDTVSQRIEDLLGPAPLDALPPGTLPSPVDPGAGLSRYVEPRIGSYPPGFTNPGPVAPYGMVELGPDTEGPINYGGYYFHNQLVSGFSHVHMSAGVYKGGYIPVLPFTGVVTPGDTTDVRSTLGGTPAKPLSDQIPDDHPMPAYSSGFDHASEVADAGYYSILLTRYAVRAELTATERAGLHRYTFLDAAQPGRLLIDVSRSLQGYQDGTVSVRNGVIRGSVAADGGFRVYFAARADHSFHAAPLAGSYTGTHAGVILDFIGAPQQVMIKVGISYTDEAGALANLDAEIPGWDFDAVRKATVAKWDAALAAIEVEGGTPDQLTSFYSALYRAQQWPNLHSDVNGRYRGPDGNAHAADGHDHYSQFSSWDSYRGQNQLQAEIAPARYNEMLHSLVAFNREAGYLPRWQEGPHDASHMSGDPILPFIGEAWCRGQVDESLRSELWPAMKSLAARRDARLLANGYLPTDAPEAYGDSGVAQFDDAQKTFVEAQAGHNSAGATLEYGVGDFALALMAQQAAPGEAAAIKDRSLNYRNLVDADGWIHPRLADGSFMTPFQPEFGYGFQEGTSWQYSWLAMHDYAGVIAHMGGDATVNQRLDTFFGFPFGDAPVAWPTAQSATTAFGTVYVGNQYVPGNEHDLEAPYVYAYSGAPWKTQAVARAAGSIYTPTPNGLPGNDDLGALSGWLVWNMAGVYPVNPGTPLAVIGSPVFTKVTMHRPGGDLVIEAPGASQANEFVQSVSVDGVASDRAWLILPRGESRIRLAMGASPVMDFGAAPSVRPPSLTTHGLAAFGCSVAPLADDSDGDGVADGRDQCPGTAGAPANNGC